MHLNSVTVLSECSNLNCRLQLTRNSEFGSSRLPSNAVLTSWNKPFRRAGELAHGWDIKKCMVSYFFPFFTKHSLFAHCNPLPHLIVVSDYLWFWCFLWFQRCIGKGLEGSAVSQAPGSVWHPPVMEMPLSTSNITLLCYSMCQKYFIVWNLE